MALPDSLQALFDKYGVSEDEVSQIESELEDASPLRRQLKEATRELEELRPLRTELASMKKAPLRKEAFEKAGVDFDALRPAEKKLIESFDWDGDLNQEQVAAFVQELQLPTKTPEPSTQPAAARIVEQSVQPGAPAGAIDPHTAIQNANSVEEVLKVAEAAGVPLVGIQ